MRSTSAVLALALLTAPAFAHAQDDDAEETADDSSGEARSGRSGSQRLTIDTPHRGSRPWQIDLHGGFTWWGVGVASGARLGIPLVENGFIDSLNNAVYLSLGFDFYFARGVCRTPMVGRGCDWEYGPGFGFPVTLHWQFYFNETFSAFAEVGGQFFIHPEYFQRNNSFDIYDAGYWFIAMVGGMLHLSENFALVLRIGTPYTSFGITFLI